jgi:hypothetical protein
MQRFNPAEAMMRTYHTFARITINKADPSRMMQELAADFFFGGAKGDNRERIEQVQNYGFTATPLPRSRARPPRLSWLSWAASATIRSSWRSMIDAIGRED